MMQAAKTARRNEKSGPAKATMILSIGLMGGSGSLRSPLSPSMDSMGAICGKATNPPAGMEPRPYWTPLMVFFQMGLPNQIWNLSTCSPLQRAARKCPSSWTKMMMLKLSSTRKMSPVTLRICKRESMK